MSLLSQAAAQADLQELAIDKDHLITDGKTQARLQLDPATLDDYAALLRTVIDEGSPWPFPPVQVIRQTHAGARFNYVWDGFHRIQAARTVDWPFPIPALVRPGTQRDAILAAVGANHTHGLRRTNADKRRAVEMLLQDAEWRTWSDRAIADQTDTTHPFVAKIRAELYPPSASVSVSVLNPQSSTGNDYQSTPRKGRDGRTIDTSRIGNTRSDPAQNGKAEPYASVWQLENGIRTWLEEAHIKRLNISPYAIRDIATRYPHAPAQTDLNNYLPEPRRKNEMVQALNNVAAQVEQAAGKGAPGWPQLARNFLAIYQDAQNRTAWTLTENQVHHANSPCYQAFASQYPKCPDPKSALRTALYAMRPELAPLVPETTQKATPTPPSPPADKRYLSPQTRKILGYLKTFSAWLTDDDDYAWIDTTSNAKLSQLRLLLKDMISDLAE